jgi:acyl-coenzyme A synthetase/AMP-(fatty) acid ligase
MTLDWLIERTEAVQHDLALIQGDDELTFLEVLGLAAILKLILAEEDGICPGAVVGLPVDDKPATVFRLLALLSLATMVVPLPRAAPEERKQRLADVAQIEFLITEVRDGENAALPTGRRARHPLYAELRAMGVAGLVLFTAGSTGSPKAVLHDASRLLAKYQRPRPAWRTLAFLPFDHIGGINTLFHTLANGGTLVLCPDRTPEAVCAQIERHRVELLPTSPTFLNWLLLSEAWQRYDLSSLRRITYGTEPMREATLRRLRQVLPQVEFSQTYGLSELGILRTKSKSSDSLLVKVGGEGFETKVVDGVLWVRARSAMVGYLNAPSPFDDDGWYNTGDVVQQEGDYVRILGRQSEVINVGGQKVHPAEVESAILELPNVAEVTVRGESNPITGQMVVAELSLREPEEIVALRRRVKQHCRARLAPFQVPARIVVKGFAPSTAAFKKKRL